MAHRDEGADPLEGATTTETAETDLAVAVVAAAAGSDGRRSGGTPTTNETAARGG
jgi:hypothetical protein